MLGEQPPAALLDSPTPQSGSPRVLLSLSGALVSVVSFVRGADLKRELNARWRQQHPHINAGMSLSKLRRLKSLLLQVVQDCDLELSTAALAALYLERLCLRNAVDKRNRKAAAACCLSLACKFNEGQTLSSRKQRSSRLWSSIEQRMEVRKAEMLRQELYWWLCLELDLAPSPQQLQPHFTVIAAMADNDKNSLAQLEWSSQLLL